MSKVGWDRGKASALSAWYIRRAAPHLLGLGSPLPPPLLFWRPSELKPTSGLAGTAAAFRSRETGRRGAAIRPVTGLTRPLATSARVSQDRLGRACVCVCVCGGGGGFSRARSAPQFRPPCHPRPVPHNCLALDSPLPLPPGPGGRSPGHPRLASSGRPEEQVPGTGRGESAAPAQRRPTWVRAGSSLRPRPSSGPALPSSGRLAAEGGGGSGQPEPDATGRARRAGTGRAGGGPRFRAGGGRGPERAQPEQTAGDRSRQARWALGRVPPALPLQPRPPRAPRARSSSSPRPVTCAGSAPSPCPAWPLLQGRAVGKQAFSHLPPPTRRPPLSSSRARTPSPRAPSAPPPGFPPDPAHRIWAMGALGLAWHLLPPPGTPHPGPNPPMSPHLHMTPGSPADHCLPPVLPGLPPEESLLDCHPVTMGVPEGRFHFAIDRGGTFTDVFAQCPGGHVRVLKLLSEDPANYMDAPTEGIRRILEQVARAEWQGGGGGTSGPEA